MALVGLDGATFRVLDPVMEAGAMPALKRLMERGARTTLRSTVPTYTPPAWTSMATGVNPGRHGIIGFIATTPQEPLVIAHSGLIGAVPVWRFLNGQDTRAGIFNVPMTYPPAQVDGFMIAGGLAAGLTDPELPNFASDAEVGRVVVEIAGGRYPLDTVVSYENDWRSPSETSRIEAIQRLRRRVLTGLLQTMDIDFLFAVFEGPDRLQHLHYQYIVDCSDWYSRPEAAEVREGALSYFEELDRAIDALAEWAGRDGHIVVVSDHGFGPWEKTVNLNLLLEQWGYLKLPAISKITRLGVVAGTGQRLARRLLPRNVLQTAKSRVNQGIDWKQTRAFASHVAEQGIHVNELGSLPKGWLRSSDADAVTDQLIERLQGCNDPADGKPIVDRVVKREEVVVGPYAQRAPHIFPFCRDQRYELSDTLAAASFITDHRDRPWGYHHEEGVFIAAGPGIRPAPALNGLDIVDVLPTALHAAGYPIPNNLDGRVATAILGGPAATQPVTIAHDDTSVEAGHEYPFSSEEERLIEDSLRGLGYLE